MKSRIDIYLKEDPERLYYLHDELGSTTKVIAENGKTSAHYNYDEFGRPLPSRKFDQNWPGPDNTFGYTGYQYDVSSDLYYAQARYYNAEIGRFISEDPWKGTIVEPNTMNPYPYVLNNPLKYVDPLGLFGSEIARVDDGGGWTGCNITDNDEGIYDPYNWENELQNNIKPLIDKIPKHISNEQRIMLIDAIIIAEAIKLQDKYYTIYNASNNLLYSLRVNTIGKITGEENVYEILKPLYEEYKIESEEQNELVKGFMESVIRGLYIGTWYATTTPTTQGTGKLASYGDEFGKVGRYVKKPEININWNEVTEHGWQRISERGVTKDMINNWVKNGKALSQNGGNKFAFVTKDGVAVVDKTGKLITTWTKANFDDNMKNIVQSLFGN